MGEPMNRTGKCLCGAVQYTAKGVKSEMSACHCGMCRRWAGGPFLAVSCDEVDWSAGAAPKVLKTSAWAERGFCEACGSAMFYRITADGPMKGATTVAFGTLDDQAGFAIVREWYIDLKPDAYTLEGEREGLTEAQINAMFSMG